MYVNPDFKGDEATAWRFVKERGFGTFVAVDNGRPVASPLPFVVIDGVGEAPRLRMHVARPDPLHGVIAQSPHVLITISGADAYVSPDWHRAEHQVPTWNYIAVHLEGTARVLPPEETLEHVEALSQAFERRLLPKKPWSTSKMPEMELSAMLRAIVALEVRVERMDASFELSQNKAIADRIEVARMLDWRGGWNESAICEAMKDSFATASPPPSSVA